MTYVDGYVLAVPEAKRADYEAQAEVFAGFAKKYGALSTMEGWQDDVKAGKGTDFFKAVQCQPGEKIVFAWTLWPSKEARDAGIEAMQGDPDFGAEMKNLPFDGKRMIFGGFETFIEH